MKTVAWFIAAAALAAAAPASAITFVMNLTGSSSVSGSYGNVRTFTSTVGAETLTLQASAWTNAIDLSPDKIKASYLGAYSGGLGVTSPGESGSSSTHVVDNVTREDFIRLKFDRAVDLTSMYLSVYDVNPSGSADSDATVFYKDGATAPVNNGLSSAFFPQFTSFNVAGGSSSGTRIVDVGGNFSDTWLVSAKVGHGGSGNDGFKLKTITLVARDPVPEPSTWAMLILGFGSAGVMLRRRRSASIA